MGNPVSKFTDGRSVFVVVKADQTGLRHRRWQRVKAVEATAVGNQLRPLLLEHLPHRLVGALGMRMRPGVGNAFIHQPGDRFGGIDADTARGVTLRADNGPQYIARHFTRQIAHWGMTLSHAFPHQPETNGVCERFFRTLKEQAIFGRIFHTADEVRAAVSEFVARYNNHWRLARLGFRSPLDYRARHAAVSNLRVAA